MTNEELLFAVCRLLETDGEDMTDGECLDAIAQLLNNNGWSNN